MLICRAKKPNIVLRNGFLCGYVISRKMNKFGLAGIATQDSTYVGATALGTHTAVLHASSRLIQAFETINVPVTLPKNIALRTAAAMLASFGSSLARRAAVSSFPLPL